MLAINTARSTGFTPAYLNFGRELEVLKSTIRERPDQTIERPISEVNDISIKQQSNNLKHEGYL